MTVNSDPWCRLTPTRGSDAFGSPILYIIPASQFEGCGAGSRFSAAEEGGLLRGVQKSGYLIPLKEASYDFAFVLGSVFSETARVEHPFER